ncbi:hypothetical protein [Bradyrhizobium sp. HKCCYLS20291]|uniref:hypothetical protein n=1 Tax=Bradyrhizobium sp. HKCCYLS20291 TaxID=3420766 RepID=UPI003EB8F968
MTSGAEDIELVCLGALSDARADFFGNLVAHAEKHNAKEPLREEDLEILRADEAFQIAKFYYLAEKHGLNSDKEALRSFLNRHNEALQSYLEDDAKIKALDLSKQRLRNDGLFSEDAIEQVCELSTGKLRLDQADLGRLLSPLYSAETIRKAVLALAKGGLLIRARGKQAFITSNGALENYFALYLRLIVDRIKEAADRRET